MVESNSYKINNMYPNLNAIPLNDPQQFRLLKLMKLRILL